MRTNPTTKKWHSGINKSFDSRIRPAKRFCKLTRKKVYPKIKFRTFHNNKYARDDLLDVLTHIAMTHDFTTNGSRTYKLIRGDKAPSAKTVLYQIRRLDPREVQSMFESAFNEIYKIAKSSNVFRREVDVAIDLTEQLYYGDKNDQMVVETKPRKGTCHAYRFATINIVVSGRRFTLLALPMHKFTTKVKVVETLIKYAKKKIHLGTVYLDRGFFSVEIINLLKKLGVKFLMPAIRNSRVKRMLQKHDAPTILDFEMGKNGATFKLVIVEDGEGIKRVFATNLNVDEKKAKLLFKLYGKRWGIETSYRVKGDFRPKTTSKRYVVRLFYFSFSTCLYNLWILANIFIGIVFGEVHEKPLVTARIFSTLLYIPFSGGGRGP